MSRELRREAWERRRERELLDEKRKEFALDLRAVAGSAEGRRFLRWLLAEGNLLCVDYQPGLAGAYAAGKKAAALAVADHLRRTATRDVFLDIVFPEGETADADFHSACGEEAL